jgi:phosphatidyl-myo-inositol dimannoside synthase
MTSNVLFLTLRIFSEVGGIEKVCKILGKSLTDLQPQLNITKVLVMSMYDSNKDVQTKYIPNQIFIGANNNKINFVANAVKHGIKSKVVVISHINLLVVGYIIKMFSPKTKLILIAHGIEVWNQPTFTRKKMLNQCNAIWCVSNFTKDKISPYLNNASNKVQVLNNCIDPFLNTAFTVKSNQLLKKFNFNKEDIILLTLSRLSSKELYKGYDHVLAVFNNLTKYFPTLKYLIVGKYDSIEKQRLDVLIAKYGIENKVVFSGYIPDDDIANHYAVADVYVMPSKKEGFGIVFIEAMYYGLPVIAGNIDGSVDALLQGKLGFLVNPDNEQEIELAIKNTLENIEVNKPNIHLLNQYFSFDTYKKNVSQLLKPYLIN